ncbi:MAG TPA: DUF2905 domain-containing protein [Nitrospirales bacterium]|jgi:hypothetical protein|nr:DUF2905 domain-containing protein [Nitrospirales bacterium]
MDMSGFGKILIVLGLIITVTGALLAFAGRLPGLGPIGKLPGDILIKRDNFTFFFPITTSILASVILSLLAWLLLRR